MTSPAPAADEIALATEALLVDAQLAREDPKAFFSFVMREETTHQPIVAQPHQRVLFDFVMAFARCVIRMPTGASKTFCMSALTMWLLGQDPTVRGALISSTQGQAAKPLKMVADYLTQPQLSAFVRLAFPALQRSQRKADPWSQSAITVDRLAGIRDPSLVAIGVDGALPGARLAWAVVDDILDRENTSTPAGRDKVHEFVDSTVLPRMDPHESRIVVCNTPWHPDDVTYRLERAGWPTLTMDVEGGITLSNVPDSWDTPDLRPSKSPGEVYRLAEHDPDDEETKPLWPLRFDRERIEELRRTHLPHRFNQLYLCKCRDNEQARCKLEWLDKCKLLGRGMSLVGEYRGPHATVTGVDLGVGQDADKHDRSAFVTVELLPSGKRRLLDVEAGRWDGPTIVAKIIRKHRQYNSIVRVENNSAQDYILQFVRASNASVPVKAHTTGRQKANPEFGIESIFVELANGGWIIPCDVRGHCHPSVQQLLDGWLYYDPGPGKHTPDLVMAAWFAREQARDMADGRLIEQQSSLNTVGMSILAR